MIAFISTRPGPRRGLWIILCVALLLTGANRSVAGQSNAAPDAVATPSVASIQPGAVYSGTLPFSAQHYDNPELGIAFSIPDDWKVVTNTQDIVFVSALEPDRHVWINSFHDQLDDNVALRVAAERRHAGVLRGLKIVAHPRDESYELADGRAAWLDEYYYETTKGESRQSIMISAALGGRLFTLGGFGQEQAFDQARTTVEAALGTLVLKVPLLYGVPRDQALVWQTGESSNPREYDPATSNGAEMIPFSGLVALDQALTVQPDLAAGWDLDDSETVYTFHLRQNARFHDGRAVTAADVIYSWQRAADPATASTTVLSYLGDIVGMADVHAGKAKTIAGLKALDDHTLEVKIDAPKPYFLMKLAHVTASVVDRANVESGADWYRHPNGTGAYKLVRWDSNQVQVYERFAGFYLTPPAVRYLVVRLYAGTSVGLYETGDIDLTGVPSAAAPRVLDPTDPLHDELQVIPSLCTNKVNFDLSKPPFDDLKVRQAFALAIDRQIYVDRVSHGVSIPAAGLYPPQLPGYNADLHGQQFDPKQARRLLQESRYGGAANLPPIIFTASGLGTDMSPGTAALVGMWQQNLGVAIKVENLEPSRYVDELDAGRHGQLFNSGWCGDYTDPENFADVLFHSGADANRGHYANAALDKLLEQARTERDGATRLKLYQQAEQMLVDDSAAIFLSHGLTLTLVKPYVHGFVSTAIDIAWERYVSLDPDHFK